MRFFYGGNMSKLTKNQIEINEDAIKMASDNTWYFYYKFLEDNYTISFKKYGDFSSKEQAKKKYVRVVSEYRKQIDNVKNSVHIEYTLKSYLSYWLYGIQFPKVAPRRQCVLDYVVNHIILLSIEEDILLDKITPSYLNELFSRCKKYSQTSGWMAQSVMSTLLKTAVEDQYLHNNPMDAVIRFPRNIPNYHVVPYDKMTSFLKNAKKYADAANTSDGVYLEILLGLLCGLRLGEILALRFEDFDYDNQTVLINKQLACTRDTSYTENGIQYGERKPLIIGAKTKASYRLLKIHPVIFEELEKRKAYIAENMKQKKNIHDYDGYICVNKNGSPKAYGILTMALTRISDFTGIPRMTTHGLRHTCASMLLEFGVPIEEISEMLGHENISTTLDIYCTTIQGKQDIAEMFEKKLILLPDEMDGE